MLGLVTRVQPHFTLYYMPGCHVNKIYMENQCIKNMKYAGTFFIYCFQGTLPIYVYFSIKPEVSKETKTTQYHPQHDQNTIVYTDQYIYYTQTQQNVTQHCVIMGLCCILIFAESVLFVSIKWGKYIIFVQEPFNQIILRQTSSIANVFICHPKWKAISRFIPIH